MAPRIARRSEWHQVNGKWSRSLGQRGMRVRLFQKSKDGPFYRAVWLPGVGRDVASLGTTDRMDAERLGKLLLAELLRGSPTSPDRPISLSELRSGGPLAR